MLTRWCYPHGHSSTLPIRWQWGYSVLQLHWCTHNCCHAVMCMLVLSSVRAALLRLGLAGLAETVSAKYASLANRQHPTPSPVMLAREQQTSAKLSVLFAGPLPPATETDTTKPRELIILHCCTGLGHQTMSCGSTVCCQPALWSTFRPTAASTFKQQVIE